MIVASTLTEELLRVLWACYTYWETEPLPVEERAVCFSWVEGKFKERFGGTFHQSKLAALADLGHLVRDDDSRGGHRCYYKLADPQGIRELTAGLERG